MQARGAAQHQGAPCAKLATSRIAAAAHSTLPSPERHRSCTGYYFRPKHAPSAANCFEKVSHLTLSIPRTPAPSPADFIVTVNILHLTEKLLQGTNTATIEDAFVRHC